MKKLIFFDTNFIVGAKPTQDFMKILVANSIIPYTSDFIIYELKGQKVRSYKEIYDQINESISKCKSLYTKLKGNIDESKSYLNIELNVDMNKCYKKVDQGIEVWIHELFEERIIKKDNDSVLMNMLFERNRYKTKPFVSKESDKGWMDTLIWTNFLDFCKNENYDNYIFLTLDDGFLKHRDELQKEFEEVTSKSTLEIIDCKTCQSLLSYFNLDTIVETDETKDTEADLLAKKEQKVQKVIKEEEIDKNIIPVAQYIIKHFTLTAIDSYYDDAEEYNFYFHTKFSIEMGKRMCDVMNEKADEYTFFSEIDMSEIFSEIGVKAEVYHFISKETYLQFVKLWIVLQTKRPSLIDPFLKYLVDALNKMTGRIEI